MADKDDKKLTEAEIAELEKLEAEEAAKLNPAVRLQQLQAKRAAVEKASRAKEATIEATIAPGRELYLAHDQTVPHGPGEKVMLTPAEFDKLVGLGHVRDADGNLVERAGPSVLKEAGLIQGHSAGQGTKTVSAGKK